MKKKLLYIAIAFSFVVSISAAPAFSSEASASCTKTLPCIDPKN
ncbi:hypothetical protein ACTHO0_03675 [Cytobacillus praedii]